MRGHNPTDSPPPVLLGTDTTTREQAYLPFDDRPKGVAIIGKPGTGKSSLLEHLILADLEYGTPGMVIDPHGVLAERVMQYATPEQAKRIILLEADPDEPFGLNLLGVRQPVSPKDRPIPRAVDGFVSAIKRLFGDEDEFLPRLEKYLRRCAKTLIPVRRTLVDIPRLFDDRSFREGCLSAVTDPDEQAQLRRGWESYDRMRPADQENQTEALFNRLDLLTDDPVTRQILGSRETTVPFDEVLAGDKMLLISLPSDVLSPERCDVIGAMLLCALADRIFARNLAGGQQPRLHIYLDEYQRFATATTAELLAQGRKYNAGVTMAHQTLFDITNERIRNAARLAGTMIVMGVTRPDADELAGEFPIRPKPERIETIEEIDGTEPKLIFSSTPAEDVYVDGHSDPAVDLAARTLFKYYRPHERIELVVSNHQPEPVRLPSDRYINGRRVRTRHVIEEPVKMDRRYIPDDKRKSAGVYPRPGGHELAEDLKLIAPDLNRLLDRAQRGELSTPEELADALLTIGLLAPRGNRSPDLPTKYPTPPRELERQEKITEIYADESQRLKEECIRPWLVQHLKHPHDLLRAKYAVSNEPVDVLFAHWAFSHLWGDDLTWRGWITKRELAVGETLLPVGLLLEAAKPSRNGMFRAMFDMLAQKRQQLRWIWELCHGLSRNPIMVRSGEQQPRGVKRHIVHPPQTHADALAEFAAKLVDPAKDDPSLRFTAQIRLPDTYRHVKLRPDLDSVAQDDREGPDPTQPEDIRARSRRLWGASPQEADVIPLVRPQEPVPGRVGRRQTEQDVVSAEAQHPVSGEPERVVEEPAVEEPVAVPVEASVEEAGAEPVRLKLPPSTQETEQQPRRRAFLPLSGKASGADAQKAVKRFPSPPPTKAAESAMSVDEDDSMEA